MAVREEEVEGAFEVRKRQSWKRKMKAHEKGVRAARAMNTLNEQTHTLAHSLQLRGAMDEEVATITTAAVLSHRTEMKTMTAKREREKDSPANQSATTKSIGQWPLPPPPPSPPTESVYGIDKDGNSSS